MIAALLLYGSIAGIAIVITILQTSGNLPAAGPEPRDASVRDEALALLVSLLGDDD